MNVATIEGPTQVMCIGNSFLPCAPIFDFFFRSEECYVYLIHLEEPILHAQHYIGLTYSPDTIELTPIGSSKGNHWERRVRDCEA